MPAARPADSISIHWLAVRELPHLLMTEATRVATWSQIADYGERVVSVPEPVVAPPADARRWARAVSELPLFNWLLLGNERALEAVLEQTGVRPAGTTRIAAVCWGKRLQVRKKTGAVVEADSLRGLVDALASFLGRQQRVLVPHAAGAGKAVCAWLGAAGAEAVCVPAYEFVEDPGTTAALRDAHHVLALLGSPSDAELLRSCLAYAAPETITRARVLALDSPAADTAEDCGFENIQLVAGPLGPLLDEALS